MTPAHLLAAFPLCALLAAVALQIMGCTGAWERPGATEVQLTQDQAQCKFEADKATAAIDNPVAAGMQESIIKASCMRAKGWTR